MCWMTSSVLLAENTILYFCAPDPPGTTRTHERPGVACRLHQKEAPGRGADPKDTGPQNGGREGEDEEEATQQRWERAVLGGGDDALADIRVTSHVVSDHLTATYFEARASVIGFYGQVQGLSRAG